MDWHHLMDWHSRTRALSSFLWHYDALGRYASLPSHTPRAHKGEGRAALYSCDLLRVAKGDRRAARRALFDPFVIVYENM